MSEKIKDLFRYGTIKSDERKENEDELFKTYGLYYELGNAWNLSLYEI